MCGIVGIVSRSPVDPASVVRMAEVLRHRGPDDAGVWLSEDRSVVLAHRRLAILDLSPRGRNPMTWDRGRLQVTYNGELYNYRDLRDELRRLGYSFASNSDTEVILAAYDHWGVECLQRLIGMFAFGLWDSGRRQLFLARDRLGQKPLYYSEHNGELAFASELKALLADCEFRCEVDPEALAMYLRYGYVPAPRTIFGHASKLAPAHYAIWKDGRLEAARYWDPVIIAARPRPEFNEADAARQLEELLRESVCRQMISDVPLGAFLSGGIDSSLIVALMQEQSARRVKTFTIRFDDPEFNEADHARAVADHLGTDHFEETCSTAQMIDTIGKLPEYFDEPFADASAIPTYLVSKVARQEVTVALSGDGGDELFFGYERYRNYATRWVQIAAPRMSHGTLETLLDTEMQYYAHWHVSWQDPEIAVMLGHQGQRSAAHETARRDLQQFTALERPPLLDLLTYLPDQILTKVDRASMALSLEARAPFLDHRVVEFALALPLEQKWRGGESKWLLRQLLHKRVPRDLVDRPKMGFSVPLAELFRGGLREQIESAFAGPLLEDLHICPDPAQAAWRDFLAGNNVSVDRIWTLFALTCWAKRWG